MNSINHDVTFKNNAAAITLAGALTIPTIGNNHPAVLLIAGMGPQDRDATTYFGHKPFAMLANHLASKGFAVLRYDKRGIGKSTGTFDTTVTSQDLATDAQAAIDFLKTYPGINAKQINVIGHSEGGLIAAIITANSHNIANIIFMAGAHSSNGLVEQAAIQLSFDGASTALINSNSSILAQMYDIVRTEPNAQQAETQLKKVTADYFAQMSPELAQEAERFLFAINRKNVEGRITTYNSPWYRFFFYHDPFAALTHIQVPMLALYGEFDFMAPSIVKPELDAAMQQAGNKDYTFVVLPKLNHSFQTCATGAMAEYATIQEAIAPLAVDTMTNWLVARTNNNQKEFKP